MLCTMKFAELKPETRYITFRDYKHFQLSLFLADLGEVSWNTIYTLQNVDEQVEYFNRELINLLDAHAPLRKIKVSKPYSPWYTYNIQQMTKLRDKALQKFRKTKVDRDWNSYKELRNYVTVGIKPEKRAYVEHVMRRKNSREIWDTLNRMNVTNRKVNPPTPPNLSDTDSINVHFNSVPDVAQLQSNLMLNK
ncbi:hypothetical protein JTB14_004864 [Gonioctena quinquepunctata]|nr:hypothetical protein JTB14_004864 [Gonioctena quinquepunctata]